MFIIKLEPALSFIVSHVDLASIASPLQQRAGFGVEQGSVPLGARGPVVDDRGANVYTSVNVEMCHTQSLGTLVALEKSIHVPDSVRIGVVLAGHTGTSGVDASISCLARRGPAVCHG
jgi:hypothetical protein